MMYRNVFRSFWGVLGLFLISTNVFATTQCIKIHTQEDFDKMGTKIRAAISIKEVDAVIVDIIKGTYLYHDEHLNLSALNYPQKKL